jgi:hypothetical protein
VDLMKLPGGQPVLDSTGAETQVAQLPVGEDTVLPVG